MKLPKTLSSIQAYSINISYPRHPLVAFHMNDSSPHHASTPFHPFPISRLLSLCYIRFSSTQMRSLSSATFPCTSLTPPAKSPNFFISLSPCLCPPIFLFSLYPRFWLSDPHSSATRFRSDYNKLKSSIPKPKTKAKAKVDDINHPKPLPSCRDQVGYKSSSCQLISPLR